MIEKENIETEKSEEKVEKKKRQSIFSRIKNRIDARKEKRKQEAEKELSAEQKEEVEKKFEEVNKEIDETKSPKRKKWIAIYWIFNIALILAILLWNLLSTDDFTPLGMFEVDFRYIWVAFGFVVLIMITEIISVHRMIYRRTLRSRWATSFKSVAIYRFTPLATGGQPFMVSYLASRDIPAATAMSIPISKLLFQNIAWLILSSVCMVMSFTMEMGTLISALSIIAFILTLILVVVVIMISVSKTIGQKLVGAYVKLNVKLKIWNDYDKHFNRIMNSLNEYQNVMREYAKEFFDIIYQIILAAARYVLMFSIPFFICCAFNGYHPELFGEFFILTVLVDLASHIIPLPGGGGVNVITFAWLFSKYLGGSTFWALIFWQFFTFYFYLLQGLCVIAYDTLYGNKKYKWTQKKRALQEESQEFRKLQIDNFRAEREKRRKRQKKENA
ncbi:MAG: flippase-like domain-containing protein [Clostridia bacterium]|nr:flippase-like domain-containing protein [Clostridia bacterium]